MDQENKHIDWDRLLERLEQDQSSGKFLTGQEQQLLVELQAVKAEASDVLKNYRSYHTEKRWTDLKAYIKAGGHKKKTVKLWPRFAAAASVFILLSVGGYFYESRYGHHFMQDPIPGLSAKNDLAPGKNSATLTLANGKKIILSNAVNGELAKEAGIRISKTADGQVVYTISGKPGAGGLFNTLSTAKGETYQLRLPDGSLVWLNAASSIKYPVDFAALKERRVELSGEAYFMVKHDENQPFRVQVNGQTVEDIGTAFNINSYADENSIKTTLVEGSAKVIPASREEVVLKPGQQSVVANGALKVISVNTDEAIAWKSEEFIFNGEDLQGIMRTVSRWYDVEVEYDPSAPKDLQLVAFVSRSKNISVVLNALQETGKVHFSMSGRKITVMK